MHWSRVGESRLSLKAIKRTVRQRMGANLQRLGYASGLMGLEAKLRNRGGAVALMYHSVADSTASPWIDPRNHVPAEVFEQQMNYLADHRNVIPLERLVATVTQGGRIEDGTVVITFDDGYLDNLTVAAPILAELGLPATVFLPTGYIDRGETQWVDQAYSAFKFRSASHLEWGSDPVKRFHLEAVVERQEAYRQVCDDLLASRADNRRRLLDILNECLQPRSLPPRLGMNWDEVRRLTETWDGFTVGGHTVEHTDVTRISAQEALDEIREGVGRIEDEIGVRPRFFSFCYGRTCEAVRSLLPSVGLEAAFGACSHHPAIHPPASDVFDLPRVEPPATIESYDVASSSMNGGFWRRLAS